MHTLAGPLPDVFAFSDGARVDSVESWRRKRAEWLELVIGMEYGGMPPDPDSVRAEMLHPTVARRFGDAKLWSYRLVTTGGVSPFWFNVNVLVPAGEGRFPVVIDGDACWWALRDEIVSEVLGRGYALVTFNRCEIAPDIYSMDRDTALYNVYPGLSFGALAAWAWGYSRVVDFLLMQEWCNPAQIAITGHSRGGKTVLLAGATDERIALTGPNNSGAGGAGCHRWSGEGCEKLADSMRMIAYWYAPAMNEYVGREQDIPFDQHCLKALVAPRGLVSMEALGDVWANPTGTYQTFDAAREVYRFLGAEEQIGIWFREGDHEHGLVDWQAFLDFADWRFKGVKPERCFDENPFEGMERAFAWTAPGAGLSS